MRIALRRRFGVVVLSAAVVALSSSPARASDIILPGFDLFDPMSGSDVFFPLPIGDLVPFVGVPLGSFDFGSGPVATGSTDTIIERLATATDASPTIAIQLLAMQMVSVIPIDAGLGLDFHYFTLQAVPSLGTMTFTGLTGAHGPGVHGTVTYNALTVNWQLEKGALGGPVAMMGTTVLSTGAVPWSHFPAPGAVLIPGVNFLLDGSTSGSDFFPIGTFTFTATDGTNILTRSAGVPEPSIVVLIALSAVGVASRSRRRRVR